MATDENDTRIGVILPKWLHHEVKLRALQENTTISNVVRMFLTMWVKSPPGATFGAFADVDVRDLFGEKPECPDD
jgi:hypothetical protein